MPTRRTSKKDLPWFERVPRGPYWWVFTVLHAQIDRGYPLTAPQKRAYLRAYQQQLKYQHLHH
jgi:hypothetical protein